MQQFQKNDQTVMNDNLFITDNELKYGDINRNRKFDVLKGKIIKQQMQKNNHQFDHYIKNMQDQINRTPFLTQQRRKPKITKTKKQQQNIQRFNLPFQVYHYSQEEQPDNSNKKEYQPFTVEKSSQSEEKSSQSQGSTQGNRQVKRPLFKEDKSDRMYSFAKNINIQNNRVLNSNKILPSNLFQHQPFQQPLHSHISKQTVSQLITSFLLQYPPSQSTHHIQSLICSQLQDLLSPYYLNLQNDLTSQIQRQFFTKIYFDQQEQKLDQLIYFKQQQLQIKNNRLEMLEGIVKEIKQDREIGRVIGSKIQGNLYTQVQGQSHKQQGNLGNYRQRQQNSTNKQNNSNSKNLIPYLNLKQINEKERIALSQHQKALTSKRKPNNQTARSQNRKSQNKIQKSSSSKAGRNYYYEKEKPKQGQKQITIQKNQREKDRTYRQQQLYAEQYLPHSNNIPFSNNIPQSVSSIPTRNVPPTFKQNIHPNIPSNMKNSNNELQSHNFDPTNIPCPLLSHPSQPQSFYKLQLHTLELSTQYKQNIQSVMLYEIQHMKKWLDYLEVDINQLQKEYEDKFMTLDVRAKLAQMRDKQKSLKKTIKKKIKIFWKQAKQQLYHQSKVNDKIER